MSKFITCFLLLCILLLTFGSIGPDLLGWNHNLTTLLPHPTKMLSCGRNWNR